MADQDAPKSAYELAMARLRKKDQEEGVVDRPITDAQRAAIAEARKVAEALEKLEQEYRRDRERITSERDRKIEEIRKGTSSP